jgi:hypothetical protein
MCQHTILKLLVCCAVGWCAPPADSKGASFGTLLIATTFAKDWAPDEFLLAGEGAAKTASMPRHGMTQNTSCHAC